MKQMIANRGSMVAVPPKADSAIRCWPWMVMGLALALAFLPKTAAAEDDVRLVIYTGYGTPSEVFLSGRVLEDEGLAKPDPNRSSLRNLADSVRRLESDELPNVEVVVTLGQHTWVRRTDDDGIWSVTATELRPRIPLGNQPVQVILNTESASQKGTGEAVILPDDAGVAIISDFDDTVVHTYVNDKKRMLREVLLRNPAQLSPVAGVADTFRAAKEAGAVAFFYLSGSPQNFYERINDFLRLQKLPAGPLLLKNFGADPLFDQRGYKTGRIQLLLEQLQMLKFILVGDSGESDPEVYAAARSENPDRIVGIFIRQVEGDDSQAARFEGMHTAPDYRKAAGLIGGWVRSAMGTRAPDTNAGP